MPDFDREALKRGCAADPAANDDLENRRCRRSRCPQIVERERPLNKRC